MMVSKHKTAIYIWFRFSTWKQTQSWHSLWHSLKSRQMFRLAYNICPSGLPPNSSNKAAKWITNSRIFTWQQFIAAQQSDTKMFNIQLPQTSQSASTIPYITSDYFFYYYMNDVKMKRRTLYESWTLQLLYRNKPNIPHSFFDTC